MKIIEYILIALMSGLLITVQSVAAPPVDWTLTYSNEDGSGLAAVGNSEDRNSYRGIYWTGPDKQLSGVEIQLDWRGSIDAIDYEVTVWEVDETNDLEMGDLLMSSTPVNGSDIVSGWNCFSFPSDVQLTTGKTIVVLSRTDPTTLDGSNYIRVRNGYDESDEESSQWNIHYGSNQKMAGRRPGDEDQPEYFTFNIRLYGSDVVVPASEQFPNIPEDIQTVSTSHDAITISWFERGENSVAISHYNVYEYRVHSATTLSETLIGTAVSTSFEHTGLEPESTHTYVVRAVSDNGNEGYHSLKNGTGWSTTTLAQSGEEATEIPNDPEMQPLTILSTTAIRVNWTHMSQPSNEEEGFILERRTVTDTFSVINNPGQNSSSYNDSGLTPGTSYEYRVKALNAIGESAWSDNVSGTTQEAGGAPIDLNQDGMVNILDVIQCVNAITNEDDADVDNSGATDAGDVTAIIDQVLDM